MALTKDFEKSIDGFLEKLVCQNAYCKVDNIQGGKTQIRASVLFFNKKNGVILNNIFYNFLPNMNGKNFIAQAYEHLKTLPEFAGATDC